MVQHIIKRRGKTQDYDERKVYASCYRGCMNSHIPKEKSEEIADQVTKKVTEWINSKETTDSQEIFYKVIELLNQINKDAAFMYKTHRDIS